MQDFEKKQGKFYIPKNAIRYNYNLFPSCKFNENDELSNIAELGKCCVDNCNKKFNNCTEKCKNKFGNNIDYNNCKNDCIILNSNLCRQYCRLSSSEFIPYSNIFKCATKYGCMDHKDDLPNYDCIQKKKEKIHNCFRDFCKKEKISSKNCEDYLDFMSTLPFKPKKYNYKSKKENFSLKENMISSQKDSTGPYQNTITMYNIIIVILILIQLIGTIFYGIM